MRRHRRAGGADGDFQSYKLSRDCPIYFRNTANTKWGCNVRKKVKGVMRTVWTEGGTIPSGTGFWYMRTDEGTLKVRFESVK